MSEMRIKRFQSGERSIRIKSERVHLLKVHVSVLTGAGCAVSSVRSLVCHLFLHWLHQGSDATGQRGRGAVPQGGRGGEGEREGAPASAAPFAPFQPPVHQHEKQVLQRAHASAK